MPLDDADKKYITDAIGEALKGDAVTNLVAGQVGEALQGLKLEEKVTAAVTTAVEAIKPKPDENDGKGGGSGGDDAESETEKRLKKLLAESEQQVRAEREAREAEANARKQDALRTAARDALGQAGVPSDRIPHAMAYLGSLDLLTLGDDDAPGFKGKDKFGSDAVLPLADGIAAWMKTDAAKMYLPPSGAQGDGDGNGGTGGSGHRDASVPRREDGSVNTDALAARLTRRVSSII